MPPRHQACLEMRCFSQCAAHAPQPAAGASGAGTQPEAPAQAPSVGRQIGSDHRPRPGPRRREPRTPPRCAQPVRLLQLQPGCTARMAGCESHCTLCNHACSPMRARQPQISLPHSGAAGSPTALLRLLPCPTDPGGTPCLLGRRSPLRQAGPSRRAGARAPAPIQQRQAQQHGQAGSLAPRGPWGAPAPWR